MITPIISPFQKLASDYKYEPKSQLFRLEATKVGKSSHLRYFQVHETFMLMFKVEFILDIVGP